MVALRTVDQDYFVKNLTAIRAEVRAALAVYRPSAFVKVMGPTTPAAIGREGGSRVERSNGRGFRLWSARPAVGSVLPFWLVDHPARLLSTVVVERGSTL